MTLKLTYDIGEKCWISLGGPKLSEGRVIASLQLPTHPTVFYVIEPVDSDWPHLEVRDALLMSESRDRPLTFWSVPDVNKKTTSNPDH